MTVHDQRLRTAAHRQKPLPDCTYRSLWRPLTHTRMQGHQLLLLHVFSYILYKLGWLWRLSASTTATCWVACLVSHLFSVNSGLRASAADGQVVPTSNGRSLRTSYITDRVCVCGPVAALHTGRTLCCERSLHGRGGPLTDRLCAHSVGV